MRGWFPSSSASKDPDLFSHTPSTPVVGLLALLRIAHPFPVEVSQFEHHTLHSFCKCTTADLRNLYSLPPVEGEQGRRRRAPKLLVAFVPELFDLIDIVTNMASMALPFTF